MPILTLVELVRPSHHMRPVVTVLGEGATSAYWRERPRKKFLSIERFTSVSVLKNPSSPVTKFSRLTFRVRRSLFSLAARVVPLHDFFNLTADMVRFWRPACHQIIC